MNFPRAEIVGPSLQDALDLIQHGLCMTAGVSRAGRSICSDLEGAAVDSQTFAVTVAGDVGLPAVIASGVACRGALPNANQKVVARCRCRDRDDGRAGAL